MNCLTSMPDEKLIRFYLNGDTNAMATLVELYKDRVYRSIFNLVHNKHAAEEIFQQTFISLINGMIAGKAGEEENFLQWATRVARQLCLEYNRKTILYCSLDDECGKASFSLTAVALPVNNYHESHGKIKSMIELLPDKQREVMLLNHYGGMSFNEIAETMKCTLSMALDYMKLALHNLCKMMTEKEIILN